MVVEWCPITVVTMTLFGMAWTLWKREAINLPTVATLCYTIYISLNTKHTVYYSCRCGQQSCFLVRHRQSRHHDGFGERTRQLARRTIRLKWFSSIRVFLLDSLPFDEAVASRAVFVIVSGSDGRASGRKRFRSHLNNFKKR